LFIQRHQTYKYQEMLPVFRTTAVP
jgi:hypothetical protein